MGRVQIPACQCERCHHVWVPRSAEDEPRVCPKCKSPYWNAPKRATAKKGVSSGKLGHEGSISSV